MDYADVVRVELVGSWWDRWAPLVALVVSVATLMWTVWVRHRDNARLRVIATSMAVEGPFGRQWFVVIEATNVGRVGTTVINNFHFALPKKAGNLMLAESEVPTVTLPVTLGPGEYASFAYDPEKLYLECDARGIKPSDLVPRTSTGHGLARGRWQKYGLQVMDGVRAERRAGSKD
jgi:hypothetical protein